MREPGWGWAAGLEYANLLTRLAQPALSVARLAPLWRPAQDTGGITAPPHPAVGGAAGSATTEFLVTSSGMFNEL